jgi:hypothetical protein
MHRSGTSAVTHALTALGLAGVCDPIGADWSNRDGHWESWRLLAVNNRVLAAAGGTWDDPVLPSDDALDESMRAEAAAALTDVFAGSPWVWKDPRLCFTLPFWRQVLRDCGASDPAVVLCLRNPLEVAASLRQRNSSPQHKGLDLWSRYTRAWLANLAGLPVFVSQYDSLLHDRDRWTRDVMEFLRDNGVDVPDLEDRAVEPEEVIKPALRRHRFQAAAVEHNHDVTAEVRSLFALTEKLVTTRAFARPDVGRSEPEAPHGQPLNLGCGDVAAAPMSVWVGGFPSRYGGADTELDHLIDLFRMHGVEVNLVPNWTSDTAMARNVLQRGCHIHEYRPGIFADKVVLSFCNGEFLSRLPEIVAAGRPRRVVWFNCMTWTFDAELAAHAQQWIDLFGFESIYQREYLGPQLAAVSPYRTFDYKPFFNLDRATWAHRPFEGTYRVGRISRDDGGKFAEDTWRIFDRMLVPNGLNKKVYILGYGPNAKAKIGAPPAGLDWLTWSPDAIPSADFYRTIDTLVHKTGGSRESYGRFVVEAYAHGVVPIVEDAFAFGELVLHGQTGFRGTTSDELSHYASLLAFDENRHREMAAAGREFVEKLCDPHGCFVPWIDVIQG